MKPSVVFMGTPKFAVASLQAILASGIVVKGVVTTPDKPAGRGLKMQLSDVKQFALENNLPIYQPEKLKSKSFIAQMQELSPDIIVVVAFRKLPKEIWSIPALGTFNLHASLLPQYRGAAPINWAIINGEKKTGVTTFLIDETIDTGKTLLQKEITIEPNDNAGKIHDELMNIGSQLVVETIEKLAKKSIEGIPQNEVEALKDAPKLYPTTCEINWNLPLPKIHNLIRGLSPYPTAWTNFMLNNQSKKIKIIKGNYRLFESNTSEITLEIKNNELLVTKSDGEYIIEELQLEGKKPMDAKSFINGYKTASIGLKY